MITLPLFMVPEMVDLVVFLWGLLCAWAVIQGLNG